MRPLPGVVCHEMDARREDQTLATIRHAAHQHRIAKAACQSHRTRRHGREENENGDEEATFVDVVLSDMAPTLTGMKHVDRARSDVRISYGFALSRLT